VNYRNEPGEVARRVATEPYEPTAKPANRSAGEQGPEQTGPEQRQDSARRGAGAAGEGDPVCKRFVKPAEESEEIPGEHVAPAARASGSAGKEGPGPLDPRGVRPSGECREEGS
jgi:hypothetical protein